MHGDIVYVELALRDLEKTIAFYKELFGWKIVQSHLSSQAYYMFFTPGERLSGAFDENVPPSEAGARIYLQCDDIDKMIASIRDDHPEADVLQEKTFISTEYGSYALIKDPSGNLVGLQEDSV